MYDFVFIICMFCLHDFKIFKKENVIFYPLQSLYSAVLNNSKLFFVCMFFIYKSMYHNYTIIPKLHKKLSKKMKKTYLYRTMQYAKIIKYFP